MGSSMINPFMVLFFVFIGSTYVQGAHESVNCEKLSSEKCAFAVSSKGQRCTPEKGKCKASDLQAHKFSGHIETAKCLKTCGVTRESTENPVEKLNNPAELCKLDCREECPNIFDYFSSVAAGEGRSLVKTCEKSRSAASAPSASEGDRRQTLDSGSGPAAAPASEL